MEIALDFAISAMRGTAELDISQHEPINILFAGNVTTRAIYVNVAIPHTTPAGARVCVGGLTLGGRLLAGFEAPLSVPVYVCVSAPLTLRLNRVCQGTPCITPDGVMFFPVRGSEIVRSFNHEGVPLPRIAVAGLGLSDNTCWSAYYGAEKPLLLLADDNDDESRLVAVDPASRAVRWATAPGAMDGCDGIALLPPQGVCIVSSLFDKKLFAHRLSDGTCVGSIDVDGLGSFLAADPTTGTVFSNTADFDDDSYTVNSWIWTPESTFQATGIVKSVGAHGDWRPLAVIPPAPGKLRSYLLVAASGKLHVIALPTLTLVHTHVLDGMSDVRVLAAEPSGTAIAVSDYESQAVHVLAWPLPGMPPLE